MFRLNKHLMYLVLSLVLILCGHVGAADHAAPYLPYSDDLQLGKVDLRGLDEDSYAKMSFDDIRLKNAYISILSCTLGGFNNLEPEILAALNDMLKRGDSVTPLLLKLMNENQETGFELSVFITIPQIGTIKLEPYLEYARHVLRDRTSTMSAGLAGSAASLLATHGTKEDAELLKRVMETRPFVAYSISRKLDALNSRLNLPKFDSSHLIPNATYKDGKVEWSLPSKPKVLTVPNKVKQPTSPPWITWVLLAFAAIGLFWYVLKSRKKNS